MQTTTTRARGSFEGTIFVPDPRDFGGGGQGGPPVSRIRSDQYKVPEGGHVALHVTDLEYTQTSASDPHGFQQCRL